MISRRLLPFFALLVVAHLAMAQTAKTYKYVTVPNDPLNCRIYTLDNGLTVMLSVNHSEPRIQTLIATRGGSDNDPANHTGLAHYLEHLLFKGTDRYGTLNWQKEKPYLDEIEALYNQYNSTKDEQKRAAIYHRIDSVSGIAAKYAIANEYDKMVGAIGATGTNAFTSFEETVFRNDIPENQLQKWMEIEAERFRHPVLRLFHTELEAVYEEKNRSLDNDGWQARETMLDALFQHHNYGQQTTIGTIEHLKNPSLTEIQKFYNTYYVPNNMAIILAGDFDPDQAIRMIDQHFGYMKPKPVPPYTYQPEDPITKPIVREVYGPNAENVAIAYRFDGAGSHEADLMNVFDLLLAYKGAGLIDLNLNQKQKVNAAYSSQQIMKDYSMEVLGGQPLEGQTLEQVRDLLLGQIDLIKQGKFDEEQLRGIIRNLKIDEIRNNESNVGRAFSMLDGFVNHLDWKQEVDQIDRLSHITKQEIVDFANKHFNDNYVIVYKRTGELKTEKVEKPPITPVQVNRDTTSAFVRHILDEKAPPVKPMFLDFKQDITQMPIRSDLPLFYLKNDENDLFTLYYVFDMGTRNDEKLAMAVDYLKYLGTDKYTAEQLTKKFFNLGASFNVSTGANRVYVSLTGLQESFEPALKLFEEVLANVQPDKEALDGLVAQTLKDRADAKKQKRTILFSALRNYAMYGAKNPFTDRLSEEQLKAITPQELVDRLHSLTGYKHRVFYYGPADAKQVVATVSKDHKVPATLRDYPAERTYERLAMDSNVVYFVDFPMVQAEILWLSKGEKFDPKEVPEAQMFNQYFGGDMSSVVFQEIRESKALAYATFAAYSTPGRKDDPFYLFGYVGTQADKLPEAIPAMNELFRKIPLSEQAFETARAAIRNQIATERITRTGVLFSYLSAEDLGVDHDLRRDVYNSVEHYTLADVQKFFQSHITGHHFAYAVIGARDKVDMDALRKQGRVVELSLKDIFGY